MVDYHARYSMPGAKYDGVVSYHWQDMVLNIEVYGPVIHATLDLIVRNLNIQKGARCPLLVAVLAHKGFCGIIFLKI